MSHKDPSSTACLAAQLYHERVYTNACPLTAIRPYECACDASALITFGRSALRRGLLACNGVERYDPSLRHTVSQWTEEDQALNDAVLKRIGSEASLILAKYGATLLTVHGDPRGYCMRFKLASGATNGMGEGWGV